MYTGAGWYQLNGQRVWCQKLLGIVNKWVLIEGWSELTDDEISALVHVK
jgi:hypothetical protein